MELRVTDAMDGSYDTKHNKVAKKSKVSKSELDTHPSRLMDLRVEVGSYEFRQGRAFGTVQVSDFKGESHMTRKGLQVFGYGAFTLKYRALKDDEEVVAC